MAHNLARDFLFHLIIFQAALFLILLSNIYLIHRTRRHAPPQTFPMVSILVPARNEERCIANCVQSLLVQDYPSYEILVLDDQSEDRTGPILEELIESQPRLKVLHGEPPAEGQVGKNWACAQLARQAKGELLYFTDADTFHQPGALRSIVTALMAEKTDFLTGLPCQEAYSWGERLLVPFFSWALLCFKPLALAYQLRLPILSVAVGQVMLFRRETYLAIGGHSRSGSSIVEDLDLARQIQAAGIRWRMAYIADLISCRMYPSGREAVEGFTKNLFAAFDFHLLPFLFAFIWLMIVFWEPLGVLVIVILGHALPLQGIEMAFCVLLSALLWSVPYADLHIPIWLAFLYPFTILSNTLVAFRSVVHSLTGKLTWKDRPITRPRWKWL